MLLTASSAASRTPAYSERNIESAILVATAATATSHAYRDALSRRGACPTVSISADETRLLLADETVHAALVDESRIVEIVADPYPSAAQRALPIVVVGTSLRVGGFAPWRIVSPSTPSEEVAALLIAAAEIGRRRLRMVRIAEDYAARRRLLRPRELAVIDGLIAGKSNKEIAGDLNVSVRTIEERRRSVYLRFGVRAPGPLCYAAGVAQCVGAFLEPEDA